MMKAHAEIEQLKAEWLSSLTWNIEDTPGFEEHRLELLGFRQMTEKHLAMKAENEKLKLFVRLSVEAERLQCSMLLIQRLEAIETRLAALEGGGE
jgi:hypothetical protein